MRLQVAAIAPAAGVFADQFPLQVRQDDIGNLQAVAPEIVAIEECEDGVGVVLSSIRYLTSRETYSPDEMPEAVRDEIGEFDQLVAVRVERHQANDVLWIPNDRNVFELRVDHPFGTPIQKGLAALDAAEAVLEDSLPFNLFLNQINLFPVIQSLYEADGEGMIIELAFMVAGSAQKLEKTRRGRQCCRVEAYHVAGKAGLADPIQPYAVATMWSRPVTDDISSYPEITLRGSSHMTAQPDAFLGEAIVRNCIGNEDLDHVIRRIVAFI